MVLPMTTETRPERDAALPGSPDDVARPALAEPPHADPHERPVNILLVDDEPKNLTVLESVLNNPAYRLVRAESADQALLALVSEEFALLVLDIQMPGMNGFELAQMVKSRKKTAGIPIIFLTAYYSEDQHVLEGYGSGAVDYLHKPINPAILQSKVAVFVELHRTSRALRGANQALVAEIAHRKRAQEVLSRLAHELEQRVIERTATLIETNSALIASEDRLRAAAKHKDEFLATLAHELRNPLAPIRNALHILHLKGLKTPDLDWAKDVIDRQTQQMTRLVDDLLDVSRITTGKLSLRKERVELNTVVRSAIETSRPLVEECGHTLSVEIADEPLILSGDATRLAQILSNLLNNAAKYTERGGSIGLTAKREGSEIVVTVSDTGMGITPEMLPQIFEMFTQGDRNLDRSQGGLGVGLTLVKQLVELHGGTVEARSEVAGKGSRFLVRLPLTNEQEKKRMPEPVDAESCPSHLRILVVDDNVDSANTLGMMLKIIGHETHVASDGLEALEIAAARRLDVVLLDIGMPKLDGYETCRRMRREPWGKGLILIAQTGWGQDEDRRRTREAGFDYHLVKPIHQGELMKLLAEAGLKKLQPAAQ